MKHMIAMLLAGLAVAGCSGGEPDKDHVWKEQTDTIKKAEQVEDVMKQRADRDRKQIDDT